MGKKASLPIQMSPKMICLEAACSQAAFLQAHSGCFILTALLSLLFCSLPLLPFCFVITSVSFISTNGSLNWHISACKRNTTVNADSSLTG